MWEGKATNQISSHEFAGNEQILKRYCGNPSGLFMEERQNFR